jgi:hypothetical protein
VSDGDDEYRFDPADVDEGAEGGGFDAASAAVGCCIGVGGVLFLAEPFVDPFAVGGTRVPAVFLSVVVVAAGLLFGAVVFLRRGLTRVGLAHAVAGGGWGLVVLGTLGASGPLLFAGFAVLVGGSVGLVAVARDG